ncbi:MAG TPA: glycosyl hydrolase [Cellvibrionaceae bacterium]
MPMKTSFITCVGIVLLTLNGCNSIDSNSSSSSSGGTVACAGHTANPDATAAAKALFNGLLQLSCGARAGVLSGQNAGHGDQINDANEIMGYAHAVKKLVDRDSVVPAVLGVDYEHDRIFTPVQLSAANRTLIEHVKAGGVVTINWSALSPWVNDARDLVNHPGDWLETRTPLNNPDGKANYVNLTELLTPGHALNTIWRARLDAVAAALAELQTANVPVLWRPLQEMSGTHFWWGANLPLTDAAGYVAVWRDMYRYFTVEKHLNNLLWVYSPEAFDRPERSVFWAYPGDDVVDVIAATSYSSALNIPAYTALAARASSAHKPLAMGEYGPPVWGEGYEPVLPTAPLTFDAKRYARLLTDYPNVAYWVSWHSYYVDAERINRLSLSDSAFTKELFSTQGILNRSQTDFLRP